MKGRSRLVRITMLLTLLVTLAATAPARAAGTCYVDDSATGINDGSDWTNAYTNLQDAISDPCTEIWVAAGTYKPNASLRAVSFQLENGTAIYGGFNGTETMLNQRNPKTNVTILSGDLNGDDSGFANNGENSYHVVFANSVDNTAILDGFTISGGNANGSNPDERGGGIYAASNTGATLANLTFSSNAAISYGGGMFADASTSSTLTNVTFKDNTSNAGGGLYMTLATISLLGVTFSNNTAYAGGGIAIANQMPTLTNVTFSGNSATLGGGLYLYDTDPTLTNVTISGNSATVAGGGLYVEFTSVPKLTNVIIANSANGGDCYVNSGSIDITSSNNLIEDTGGNACGLTNGVNGDIIGSDPGLYPLADNGGPTQTLVPQLGSPAIDTGTNTNCTGTDQRGASRPYNSTCDIGAVELTPQTGANRTVTKLADTNAVCDVLTCSLREAIASAGSGNTITFDSSLSGGTIYLDLSNTLNIYTNLTIDGSALPSKITISGDSDHNGMPDVTVFFVGFGVNATLSDLIITKGFGGLYNNGTATVNNSIFSANDIDNQEGGGIKNTTLGNLTVNNSTFTGNLAANGAAIANYNNMTIANSTFVNNGDGSTGSGGAIYTAALATPGLTQTITNSTFSGNASNSASAIYSDHTQTIINSTFSGNIAYYPNGYAVYQDQETLNLSNTIIANSTNGDCLSNAMGTNTNNLVEDGGCSATLSGDPLLGTLASNGGPTQTFALLPGSKAIGTGDDATCAAAPVSGLDQRGIARPNGDHCDIGAYEHQDTGAPSITAFTATNATTFDIPITAFNVLEDGRITGYLITESATTPALNNPGWSTVAPTEYTVANAGSYTLYPWVKDDASNITPVYGSPQTVSVCLAPATVTSNADSGTGTLRKAIADACTGATITFGGGLSGDTIHLASTLTLSKNVTIDGSSLGVTISGDSDNNTVGDVRVFGVDPGVTVTLDSLTIAQGYANEAGAIFNEGNLTITNSTVAYNTSTGYSGAISSNTGSLTITDSTFYVNTALGNNQGAGAILNNGDMTITGSTFVSNTASLGDSGGGAIYNTDPDTTISNSTFSGNAAGKGGAIYTTTSMTIKNSTFSDNSANNTGGLYIDGGTTNLENTVIANSTNGDCTNTTIGLGTNINNLIEDGSCFPFLSGDPNLGALASNGGPTQTVALLAGSIAINAGDDVTCSDAPINNLDQRGTARPNGPHCDIGAYEYVDTTAPTVTAFAATSPINSLSIPITSFTASDDVAVTGYKITESSTPPSAGAAGWTASAPTTYTVSSDGSYTLYPWAKDVLGNVSAVYGSPVSVTVDTTAPTVSSITLVNANPTNKASAQFIVTFSEPVTGVSSADFTLTKSGVTGSAISSVSGSGATYTVTVNTGSGNGTLRIDVPVSATVTDMVGNALTGLPYTSGASYLVNKTLTFTSNGTQDGWILESFETSGVGGTLNTSWVYFRLGDDASKKQYRGILSFNTASIPDTAVITSVMLKVKQQSVTGGNPVSIFQGFFADVKTGFFGTASALQTADFQATASKTVGPTSPALTGGWYSLNLANAKTFINKLTTSAGLTQIRLRFKLDDNNNAVANYVSLYSGNVATVADRPQLVITYYVP